MSVRKAGRSKGRVDGRRRGATLVIVAVLFTMLMMFAGFGIDFSRMYAYKSQLKVLADAAALSGVTDLKNGQSEADAKARAVGLKASNLVENAQAVLEDADIEPGIWDDTQVDSLKFTTSAWSAANAVRATPRYTASWTLARIFGVSNRTLTESSVARLGSQISSGCLAPVAVNFKDLLREIPRDTSDTSPLTQADIDALLQAGTPMPFKVQDQALPGSFSWVALDSTTPGQNKIDYLGQALEDAVSCSGKSVKVGDTLHTITGVNGVPPNLIDGLRAVCPRVGNGQSNNWDCSPAQTIEVPIYGHSYGTGAGGRYVVKYIGAVKVTRVEFQGNKSDMFGFITAIGGGGPGSFSPLPGPVFAAALVR